MKRNNFSIQATNGHEAVKHTWNASIRHIEDVIGQIARNEGARYELVRSESEKGADGNHVRGHRVWRSTKTGQEITFSVRMLD